MNYKKMSFHPSILGLSLLVSTVSAIGCLISVSTVQARSPRPDIAKVTRIDNGDNACYVSLVDQRGQTFNSLPAAFDICAQSTTFLNKRVRLVYEQGQISDCQSAEPCGRSKKVMLIKKMYVYGKPTGK